jgi:hypothetical protein
VKVRGLWYDDPVLDPYRDEVPQRGGRYKGKWLLRYDKRDPREVFFQDPATMEWTRLRWVGLPPEGEIPSFGDARRDELLRMAADAGLAPKSDAELLPVLLELVGGRIPVDQWPTQMSKQQRIQHAREVTQAAATAADSPARTAARTPSPPATAAAPDEPAVPLQWSTRAQQTYQAIDSERRRRREDTAHRPPQPPPRLGEGLRRRSPLFLVEGIEHDEESTSTGEGQETP